MTKLSVQDRQNVAQTITAPAWSSFIFDKNQIPPILFMHPSVFGFITLMYVLKNDLSNKAAFEEAAFYEEALECKFC